MIVFTKYFLAGDPGNIGIAVIVAASVLAGFISFEFIESPFRGFGNKFDRKQIFYMGAVASILSVACALLINLTNGLPQRFSKHTLDLLQKNTDQIGNYDEMGACSNFRTAVRTINDISFCEIAHNPNKNILFWGDSHVQQIYPLIQNMQKNGELGDEGAVFAVAAGCTPVETLNRTKSKFSCDAFSRLAKQRAEQDDIDTVYIGFATWWALKDDTVCVSANSRCVKRISKEQAMDIFFKELAKNIAELKSHGKRVIVALPYPIYDKRIPLLEIRNSIFGFTGDMASANEFAIPGFRARTAATIKDAGGIIFDPRTSLCVNEKCVYQKDGVSFYKDDSHLTADAVQLLDDNMRETLAKATQQQP